MPRLAALLVLALAGRAAAQDVVVYGGTASGVVAAVAAAREGKRVLLLEPGKHLGGMTTGGLGATDTGNRRAIGGYSREVYFRIRNHYATKYGPQSPQLKDCDDGYKFEPHVAALVLTEMLQEAKVEVRMNVPLDGVKVEAGRIVNLVTIEGRANHAAVYIDATYEGDLMAAAGVKFHVGREGREVYNESLAGVQARSSAHQFGVAVNALAGGKPIPLVQAGAYPPAGSGDRGVQAYNFRLCMTDRPANRVPWPKPANYDPARYELLARYLAARPSVKFAQLCNPVRVPNGKTDTNNNGPVSTDHIGANWDYPTANDDVRGKIRQDHVEYTQGFFHFLASDPRVPKPLHDEANEWGLAKDEFADTANWPHQLYVREARRMIGEYVMTQADILTNHAKPDSVGLGSYNTDSHHIQRLVDKAGNVINEGDFQVGVRPYAIPYRCLTPKAAECTNLLVPVCCSASHVAYGTIRMEPVYMVLGHACGVAAAMAADGKVPVQQVSAEALAAKLLLHKAVLDPAPLAGAAAAGAKPIDPAKLFGTVADDAAATVSGDWSDSAAIGNFVAAGYKHDKNEDKGKKAVRFAAKLPAAGKYEVFLHFPSASNRATNVPVVVSGADGEKTVTVDQRMVPGQSGLNLGTYSFAAAGGWVEVRTTGTDGFVVADAVRFVAAM